jgi:hypothetical protein
LFIRGVSAVRAGGLEKPVNVSARRNSRHMLASHR